METKICVVGLGYVGLPLACLLSQKYPVYGFDISERKINDLKRGFDETGEVDDLNVCKIEYSNDPKIISEANFIIVAVPTPVDDVTKEPDISLVISASKLVGQNLKSGSIVVYESTVYPGCTEEDCLPVLEQESGLKLGTDFKIGYSPERVNPGDKVHTIDKIVKVVSGSDQEALDKIAEVYGSITNVHKASSIKVAESAKIIENIQRDLNIALMNELSIIFDMMNIPTKEVIDAAGTKWNFNKYYPGLVGGHCIGVDPYYLTHKAEKLGYQSKVILAGRGINEYMSEHVAKKIIGKKVLILGLTFKENVPDVRNSKAKDLIGWLKKQGSEVIGHDPILRSFDGVAERFGIELRADLDPEEKFDAIILFSPHRVFAQDAYALPALKKISNENATLFDIKGFYDKKLASELGFKYFTL